MAAPLLVVDAPFLLYRSFFALPESITGVEDRPVGALLGSVNLLLRAAEEFKPRAIVTCFGAEAAHYRKELYPPYHAKRPPTPATLDWQFSAAPELFSGFGWASASSDSYEADDLLGAFADLEETAGGSTLILTGDRDMYQCARTAVTVVFLKAGKAGFDPIDAGEVRRRYGVGPELVPDFIALRGDPSDGLPGAPGIGEKTAGELLRQWGSLDALLEAVGSADAPNDRHGMRPKLAAALRDHADELRAFREIATLQPVAVERPDDAATDRVGGGAAAERLGMRQLSQRMASAEGVS